MSADLLLNSITPAIKSFVLVVGAYNFAVVKGFAQPCVGLLTRSWLPEYRLLPPFDSAERIELVISVMPPESLGYDSLRVEAVASANFEVNRAVLQSIVRDSEMAAKTIVSKGGVFAVARERFRAKPDECPDFHSVTRDEYLRLFVSVSTLTTSASVAAFCQPPDQRPEVLIEHFAPPKPSFENQAAFDKAPAAEQAAAIAQGQAYWQSQFTPGRSTSSGTPFAMPPPKLHEDGDFKGTPTAEELESFRDERWKRY